MSWSCMVLVGIVLGFPIGPGKDAHGVLKIGNRQFRDQGLVKETGTGIVDASINSRKHISVWLAPGPYDSMLALLADNVTGVFADYSD